MNPYLSLSKPEAMPGVLSVLTFSLLVTGQWDPFRVAVLYAAMALYSGFGFAINYCFDQETDVRNRFIENPIAEGHISFRGALAFSLLLAAAGLALSSLLGTAAFALYASMILLIAAYSTPPVRLKSRPPFEIISQGFFGGLAPFAMPFAVFGVQPGPLHYSLAFSFLLGGMVFQFRNYLRDYGPDREAGLNTLVNRLGYRRSEKLFLVLKFLFPVSIYPAVAPEVLPVFLAVAFLFYLVSLTNPGTDSGMDFTLAAYTYLFYVLVLAGILNPWQ